MTEISKCIFYHIQKTGGTWVTAAIKNACPGLVKTHGTHAKEKDHPKGNKKAFTFVRHPVSWYESMYWFEYARKPQVTDIIFCRYVELSIDDAVRKITGKYKGWLTNYIKDLLPNMDFIGRQETLSEDLMKILDVCGEYYDKEKLLATPPQNVSNKKYEMSEKSKELIVQSEKYLVDKFYDGYIL